MCVSLCVCVCADVYVRERGTKRFTAIEMNLLTLKTERERECVCVF